MAQSPYELQADDAPPREDHIFSRFLKDCYISPKDEQATPIGLAIFGTGRAGTIHLTFLAKNPRVNVLYVVEDLKERWDLLRNHWNLKAQFLTGKDAERVYQDPRVDAVVIATPTFSHEGIILGALEYEKAVFCEKPVTEDIEKTRRCYEKALRVGKPLQCGYNRRFDPSFRSLRERVLRGDIGKLQMVKTCSRDSPIPPTSYLETSGGIFHDCAIHDLDLVLWIVRELPVRVSVSATANIPEIARIDDYDTVAIVLTFPSGTIAIIDLARNSAYGYDQRVEAFGFKGMIRVDNQQPRHGLEISTDLLGPRKPPIYYSFPSRYREGYDEEMHHFLNVVQGLEELQVKGEQVLAASKVASACNEAARTKQTVSLSWDRPELA